MKRSRITSLFAVLAAVTVVPSALAVQVPEKVFEEEFDRYAEYPEIFCEDSHICEQDASKKSMDFHPKKNTTLRKTPFVVKGDPVTTVR